MSAGKVDVLALWLYCNDCSQPIDWCRCSWCRAALARIGGAP